MTAYRIAAMDMDGTLLRSDGSVSARTKAALTDASRAGLLPVVVSARPPRIIRRYCEMLEIDGLALCCNGAITYDPREHEVVDSSALTIETAQSLARALRDVVPGISFAWECGLGYGCEEGFLLEEHFADGDGPLETLVDEVSKLLVHHVEMPQVELHQRIAEAVGETGTVTISGHDVVEITAVGVDKAAGVARLASTRRIDPTQVVAFGDMPNDAPMLTWAGWGVAVENAHHDVRSIADEVTASNDEDGVALVLERLVESAIGGRTR